MDAAAAPTDPALGGGQSIAVPAALFVVSGCMIVHAMCTGDSGFSRRFGPRLAFVNLRSVTRCARPT
ncbi:MAG TPA: hypothetical protein VGC21_01415 [Telluria sp.]